MALFLFSHTQSRSSVQQSSNSASKAAQSMDVSQPLDSAGDTNSALDRDARIKGDVLVSIVCFIHNILCL